MQLTASGSVSIPGTRMMLLPLHHTPAAVSSDAERRVKWTTASVLRVCYALVLVNGLVADLTEARRRS